MKTQANDSERSPNQPAGEVLKPGIVEKYGHELDYEVTPEVLEKTLAKCLEFGNGSSSFLRLAHEVETFLASRPQGERAVAWRSIDQTKITQDMAVAFNWSLAGYEVEPLFTRPSDTGWRIPKGWKLVPEAPTPEMIAAMAKAAQDFFSEDGPYPRSKAVYRAMLAASPAPPTQEERR